MRVNAYAVVRMSGFICLPSPSSVRYCIYSTLNAHIQPASSMPPLYNNVMIRKKQSFEHLTGQWFWLDSAWSSLLPHIQLKIFLHRYHGVTTRRRQMKKDFSKISLDQISIERRVSQDRSAGKLWMAESNTLDIGFVSLLCTVLIVLFALWPHVNNKAMVCEAVLLADLNIV